MTTSTLDAKYVAMKERIEKQIEHTDRLADELECCGTEVDAGEIRDALATAGLEIRPIVDHNIAAYAYYIEDCNMAMDTLIEQLDIDVP